MYAVRHVVSLTTATGGAATGYTPVVNGRVLGIRYVKTDFADGVVFTITGETTGVNVWTQTAVNASATVCPRQATHTVLGAAALYAGSGVAVLDDVVLANERLQIAVTSGGDGKIGVFHVIVG